MSPRDLCPTDPTEALVVEQALAPVRELRRTCQDAPHGRALAHAELRAVAQGRELIRSALEAVLNEQACPAENKGPPTAPTPVGRPTARVRAGRNGRR